MPKRPDAWIIAIGDELLLGRLVDTNSAHIARWLTDRGIRVDGMAVIGDRQAAIAAALVATSRCDLVIVTGGLGPTVDDRTRAALAEAMDVPLVESATAIRQIERIYRRLRPGVSVPTSNRVQALLPKGAKLLANDRGTAPGVLARLDEAWVACLPGVPHEMMAMLDRLGDRLPQLLPDHAIPAVGEVHFSGIGESSAADLLGTLLEGERPQVGITAHDDGHLTVRLVGSLQAVGRRVAAIRRKVKTHLLPAAGLAPSLVRELTRQKKIITAAESCTAGAVVNALGKVSGASAVLHESVVCYHNDAKIARLGVDLADLVRYGAVSEAVVRQMATGALATTGADLSVATSGIAGPTGGSRAKPVGTVWMAVATKLGVIAVKRCFPGTRERIQQRAAAAVLQLAWDVLTGRAGRIGTE